MRPLQWFLALVLVTIGIAPASAQQSLVSAVGQVVAFTPNPVESAAGLGDLAPGCGGDRFGGGAFDNAVVSQNGAGLFRAKLVSNTGATLAPLYLQFAYFYGDSRGNLTKLLRGGDPEPSGSIPNAILSTSTGGNALAGSPRISENGTLLFGASIWDPTPAGTVTSSNDTVLYFGTPGGLAILAREGSPAPGCGGANYTQAFSGASQQGTCMNSNGIALFQSSLGTPAVSTNNSAWFLGPPGGVSLALRKGDLLPGLEQISALGSLSQMNLSGQFVTDVTLLAGSGTVPVTNANDRVLLVYTPGSGIQILAREGDPCPAIAGTFYAAASNFASIYGTGSTTFNASGQFLNNVLLSGAVTTGVDDRALLLQTVGNASVVMRRGDLAPGVQGTNPGATFSTANDASCGLTDSGIVSFQCSLAGGGVTANDDTGIWSGLPGNLQLVVREGDPAPGTPGLTFGNVSGQFMVTGGNGTVYFVNTLSSGNSSAWLWSPTLGLQCVTQNGDTIEVQPGVFRTSVGITGGVQFTNGDSRPLMIANDGTVFLRVGMTDSASLSGSSYASSAMCSVHFGTLTGLPKTISVATGGVHSLFLNAGTANAGLIYLVAGSFSGTSPGFTVGSSTIPLNPDAWLNYTLYFPNIAPLANTLGNLDAYGRANASITVPAGVPALAGLTFNHAYAAIDAVANIALVSEPASLTLVP